MGILPQTVKKVPGVVIPEKVKLTLFAEAYSAFNRSLAALDPDNEGDPVIEKWSRDGDITHAAYCWIFWELGIYEDFLQSSESRVYKQLEVLTA